MTEAAKTSIQDLRARDSGLPDTRVDMFSAKGFALAQRIANAFASSDAVPAQFRQYNLKRNKDNTEEWIENQAATGNCLVAIEVAQAVGMSVTAVMQNADVIEGKLRWSGKFVIAAINASRRFTPLRFDIKNLGNVTASYREKTTWNKELKRYNMEDKTAQVENLQCVAWALPAGFALPSGIYTLDQARGASLPVIESAPVSIKMAVEEGWYGKSGSKWQTEFKHMMLQYRAGTFFGNIHAPDIVMGMGRSAEEERDIIDLNADGSFTVTRTTVDDLRSGSAPTTPAEVIQSAAPTANAASNKGEKAEARVGDGGLGASTSNASDDEAAPSFNDVKNELLQATTAEDVDYARSLIKNVPGEEAKATLNSIAARRIRELTQPEDPPPSTSAAQSARRQRTPIGAD